MSDTILDANGAELLYWPVGSIRAGEDSATLEIQVACGPGLTLACESSEFGTVYASEDEEGPFVDLSANPIDLSPWTGYRIFTIYFHANEGIEEPIRLPLSVGVAGHSGAAWTG